MLNVNPLNITETGLQVCIKATFDAKLWSDCASLLSTDALNQFGGQKVRMAKLRMDYLKFSTLDANQELMKWLIHFKALPREIELPDLQVILKRLKRDDCEYLINALIKTTSLNNPAHLHLIAMKFVDLETSTTQVHRLFAHIANPLSILSGKAGVIYNVYQLQGIRRANIVGNQLGMTVFNENVIRLAIEKGDRDFLSLAMNDAKWTPNDRFVLKQSLDMQPPYTAFFDHPKLDKELAKKVLLEKYVKGNELLNRFCFEAQEAPPKKHRVASPDVPDKPAPSSSLLPKKHRVASPNVPAPPASSSSWEPSWHAAQSLPSQ